MKLTDWRRSHHWLRGFSDAVLGQPAQPQDENYREAYERGYAAGAPCPE